MMEEESDLLRASTRDVFDQPEIRHLSTSDYLEVVKAPEENVKELKKWIRYGSFKLAYLWNKQITEQNIEHFKTGIAPDGTRMFTKENAEWSQDIYHATGFQNYVEETPPSDISTDYYYWKYPYKSDLGQINCIMMHSRVNFKDGTHLPADRLTERSRKSRRLQVLAQKREEVLKRRKDEFVKEVLDKTGRGGMKTLTRSYSKGVAYRKE